MKNILTLTIAIAFGFNAQAQDEISLLKYSNTTVGGTARALSLGGAQGSIGADFSATTVNPAGLARYSKSEFCITPSVRNKSINTTYNGTKANDLNSKTGLNNVSLVFTRNNRGENRRKNALTTSFGIGVNKIADFNNSYTFKSDNVKSSIANFYINELNGKGGVNAIANNTASPQAFLAWQTYLIDTLNGQLVSNMGNTTNQSKTIKERGSINETNLTLASNYHDKFYFGASLGIPNVRYERVSQYSETGKVQTLATEDLYAEATGLNFKIGAIAVPHKQVRLGLAYHSPTSYNFSESVSYQLATTSNTGTISESASSAPFDYYINTPAKFILSGSYIVGKKGFISTDVDFINYKRARLSFAGTDYQAWEDRVNNVAKATFNNAINLRVGAEYKISDLFALRAGYNRQGAPAQAQFAFDGTTNNYSGGIGYRGQSYFLDAAYVRSNTQFTEYNYVITGISTPEANVSRNTNHLVFSMGWRMH